MPLGNAGAVAEGLKGGLKKAQLRDWGFVSEMVNRLGGVFRIDLVLGFGDVKRKDLVPKF